MRRILVSLAVLLALIPPAPVAAASSALVTEGSPPDTTPQNHQNEPAVAMDASHPWVLAAGANDFLDWQPCPLDRPALDGSCRGANAGVGLSGVYFSLDSGNTWVQPTYQGLTSRDCDNTSACEPHEGDIGTLPWYYENGLASGGDPAVAFGPQPDGDGSFSWDNGSRLYYANLTGAINAGFPQVKPLHAVYQIAVSRIDDVDAGSFTDQANWMDPVIVANRTSVTAFEDKEQIWADNAATSPYFGNVYVCNDEYRSLSHANFGLTVNVYTSKDGGDTWRTKQANSANIGGPFGYHGACTIRTDSTGVVYLFYTHFAYGLPGNGAHTMQKSYDGGLTWTRPRDIFLANDGCFFVDPVYGRCVLDGYAGARIDLFSAPSVDIANGAPTGEDATDEIVDVWNDGRDGLDAEKTLLSYSTNGGRTWSEPLTVSEDGDRPLYAAPAISPDGTALYVIYEAVTSPWRGDDMTSPRPYLGVLRTAPIGGSGAPGAFTTQFRGTPGDLRASYPGHDIYQERVGDYVYAAASRDYGVGLYAGTQNASVCDAVQDYRSASLAAEEHDLDEVPYPPTDCPANWGNVDIFAVSQPEP